MPDPECQRISCGFPEYILNGLVNGANYVYGDTVWYNCTRGYRLSGEILRTCQKDGPFASGEEIAYACQEGFRRTE